MVNCARCIHLDEDGYCKRLDFEIAEIDYKEPCPYYEGYQTREG